MTQSLPPLAWFRAFEAAARHLSFTAAAEELALTQPAISQHVRALETRFGTALFVRKPRGLMLTDAGRRLLPTVTESITRLMAISSEFTPRNTAGDLLTIVTSVSFERWFLSPGLVQFQARNPRCRLRFISGVWPDQFGTETADVEIRFGAPELVGSNADRIAPEQLIQVAAPTIAAKLGAGQDLDKVPRIHTVGTANSLSVGTEEPNPERPPAVLVDNYGSALDFACAGCGVAEVSNLLAAPALCRNQLVRISESRRPARDGYFLAKSTRFANPNADDFCKWLAGYVQQILQRTR